MSGNSVVKRKCFPERIQLMKLALLTRTQISNNKTQNITTINLHREDYTHTIY
jgi:hypothetical protein